MLRCVNCTPFPPPVVPVVNNMSARSFFEGNSLAMLITLLNIFSEKSNLGISKSILFG